MVPDWETCDISNWDASLSSSDFYIASCSFAEKWNKFNSALRKWSWIICSNRLGFAAHRADGYLSLQNVFFRRSLEMKEESVTHFFGKEGVFTFLCLLWEEQDEDSLNVKEEPSSSDMDEPFDTAVLVQSNGHKVHHYDFHVVYSPSYRVPVLYFRAYSGDGQLLPLDEIEKDLPTSSAKVLMESKWTFITQEEHPYLNRPWHTLHPCGRSEWMKLLLANDESMAKGGVGVDKYLVSWFSVVGQVFGLKIPFEMLKFS